ncbi:tetratricopeptide repeat protein [Crossiella sp. CA-258035]|uniref:tetratricopeptide repeat protein n=1 Tax=Crossiella sp. CA-258035 TaxID=2981138 RepID=UPI0024BC6935|nr:tetratricopeptide repeat protein [Crossiella sp. CA-258035]WHT16421.1 tetratricopeptide repeat protein [Crossiella sp. CA-258035]
MTYQGRWDRRTALRAMAALAGVATAAPLLGEPATAQASPGGDADALFKAGHFEQAGHAYEEILKKDPGNVHAARRRGYVGLLSNNFPDAEKYLKTAIALAPGDREAHRFLADCYTRQDKFALAAPHWQGADYQAYATLFAAFRGQPYEIHGDTGRAPFRQLDPIPQVEASLNGGPLKRFSFYTRVDSLGVSAKAAEEAGLRAVAKEKVEYLGKTFWFYYGILDSFALGGIELRNIPVRWSDGDSGEQSDDGMIGTWILYHFLTTIDYAGRSLILRRRTPETARKARAEAERAGAQPLPLWLAQEHLLFSRGSVAGSPGVVAVNLGGTGEAVAAMPQETAKRLRVRVDEDRPMETAAGGQAVTVYPCYPKEVRLGNAVARDAYCYAGAPSGPGREGFEQLAHLSHSFYKPFHVTLDFTGMSIHVARGPAS